ncbi:MAG: argininosuccinate lyase [Gammaproteobacteria bacterium]|nr:argininosuccinate lyase [Gammaproteobacteria bacterium]
MWGGRFSEPTDAFVARFTSSVDVDKRLYRQDIAGSQAHARMLHAIGVLTVKERDAIVSGLADIGTEIEQGTFPWDPALEDVHMNIESELVARIGDAGKKLHTARSRNDQVATDIRLWLREAIDDVDAQLSEVLTGLTDLADAHTETVMPGFTHLQSAQPVTFAHHLMAWFEMAHRDRERFRDCRKRVNVSPLGCAALAGTSFPVDRTMTAHELGFDAAAANSLDAVSDRDFALEFCAAASITAVHLSRWCEELVAWASPQWGFVTLPDRYCTGSSIMPQKKNPDVPELVRGKSGRVIGSLNALLVLMKSQPLAYNRDNQEDKPPLFDTADTLLDCLQAVSGIISAMEANPSAMRAAAEQGYATATDLADYLVRKDVPFRDAHAIVGKAVAVAIERGTSLADLDLAVLEELCPAIDASVYDVLSLEGSVAARRHVGGTAPDAVRRAIVDAKRRI